MVMLPEACPSPPPIAAAQLSLEAAAREPLPWMATEAPLGTLMGAPICGPVCFSVLSPTSKIVTKLPLLISTGEAVERLMLTPSSVKVTGSAVSTVTEYSVVEPVTV